MEKKMIVILLAGLTWCACKQQTVTQENTTYKTMTVKQEDQTLLSEYTATLSGQQEVEIRPQVSGLITHIRISEGEKVQKGQVLFIIDQIPYRAALAEAEANVKSAEAKLATARLNMESTQILREKNVVQDYDLNMARNELASAEATLSQAQAQEVNARNNLSYTEVKSPVDGVTGMIAYRVGALVNSNITRPLVTVSDNSRIYAYFSQTESQIIDLIEQYGSPDEFIRQSPKVELRISNGKIYAEKGHITAISGLVSAGTGAVTLRADFPNPQYLLRSGGNGIVIIPSVKKNCIVIPQSATYELQDKIFTYKVVNGKAQSIPITVFPLNNGTEYIVEKGLQPGDRIITEGAGLIKEGSKVE